LPDEFFSIPPFVPNVACFVPDGHVYNDQSHVFCTFLPSFSLLLLIRAHFSFSPVTALVARCSFFPAFCVLSQCTWRPPVTPPPLEPFLYTPPLLFQALHTAPVQTPPSLSPPLARFPFCTGSPSHLRFPVRFVSIQFIHLAPFPVQTEDFLAPPFLVIRFFPAIFCPVSEKPPNFPVRDLTELSSFFFDIGVQPFFVSKIRDPTHWETAFTLFCQKNTFAFCFFFILCRSIRFFSPPRVSNTRLPPFPIVFRRRFLLFLLRLPTFCHCETMPTPCVRTPFRFFCFFFSSYSQSFPSAAVGRFSALFCACVRFDRLESVGHNLFFFRRVAPFSKLVCPFFSTFPRVCSIFLFPVVCPCQRSHSFTTAPFICYLSTYLSRSWSSFCHRLCFVLHPFLLFFPLYLSPTKLSSSPITLGPFTLVLPTLSIP